jgi:hypothetical protein
MKMAWEKEHEMLNQGWMELFGNGESETAAAEHRIDTEHMAPAMSHLLDDILAEVAAFVNAGVSEVPEGEEYEWATNTLLGTIRSIAPRFYKLGAHMATRLPYASLTPCTCLGVPDDALEELLKGGYKVEGEGWVIPNFRPRKEGS